MGARAVDAPVSDENATREAKSNSRLSSLKPSGASHIDNLREIHAPVIGIAFAIARAALRSRPSPPGR